jgi:tetratricopeptide (TPR) repeat protein
MAEDITFTLAWSDIDVAVLPPDCREPGTDAFRRAITEYLQRQYESVGVKAQVILNDTAQTLTVHWAKAGTSRSVEQTALEALTRHDYGAAIPLLAAMIAMAPDDPKPYYNLGMVFSDQGRLEEAKHYLEHAVALAPQHADAVVALGVAHARAGNLESAVKTLERALAIDPNSTYANQNLGACLLKQGDADRAETHFRSSLESDEDNTQSRLGLAQSLEEQDRLDEADAAYQKIIRTAGHTSIGTLAKEGRTRIAHANLRKGSNERPDVVMYCLGALERFHSMAENEIERIGHEIAILGMQGLDINDPTKKYKLRSMPGDFSGLHLLSIMYVAFQKIAPETDVGIDLSKEYAQAIAMFNGR